MRLGRLLCVLFALCACTVAEDSKVVHIEQGPVRGHRKGDIFIFYNIPYATAPTGKDRFKAPLPPPKWMTTFDAVDRAIVCPQDDVQFLVKNKNMQEDCLIANIYAPDTNVTNLPVMFIVHGGGFTAGYGGMLTPIQLVRTKKIIAVNINYRLSAHGFLCMGTPDIPGNAGMKDVVAALRWVKENIESFGGNANDITIRGFSAGAAAVDLLPLSKSTNDLFTEKTKLIPESGSHIAPWAIQMDPLANAKRNARKYHNFVEADNITLLEEFYKTLPFEALQKDLVSRGHENTFVFVPCVERDIGQERFLEDNPVNIIKDGSYKNVPMMYGVTTHEGLLYAMLIDFERLAKEMNKKFSDHIPQDLQFETEEEKEEVAKRIKEFYFGDSEIGNDTIVQFIDYFTHISFTYPTIRSVNLHRSVSNEIIYLYEYGFPEDLLMPPGAPPMKGADHVAQSMAVSDGTGLLGSYDESNVPEDVMRMKEIIREYWLDFMVYGAPNGPLSNLTQWDLTKDNGWGYMNLSLPHQWKTETLNPDMIALWDEIYEKHYLAPIPPSSSSRISQVVRNIMSLLIVGLCLLA